MRLDEEMLKVIATEIRKGITTRVIAEKWSIHPQTIHLWKRKGLLPRSPKRLTGVEKRAIEVALVFAPTQADVARDFKRHRHTVERVVADHRARNHGMWPSGVIAELAIKKLQNDFDYWKLNESIHELKVREDAIASSVKPDR